MTLYPLRVLEKPTYPRRKGAQTSFGRWLRRGLASLAASGALLLTGCSGVTPRYLDDVDEDELDLLTIVEVLVEQPPVPNPDEEISPGGRPAPDHEFAFRCPPATPWFITTAPTTLDGYLCDESASVASVEVIEEGTFEVTLSQGAAFVVLIDPGGTEVEELNPDSTSVLVDMEAGPWSLSAVPADPMNEPYGYISVDILSVDI